MKRNVLVGMSTLSAVVALASYHTSTAGPAQQAATARVTETSSAGTGNAGASSTGASSTGVSSTDSTTVTGDAVQTRYGPVQVQITVSNGRIVAAQAVQYPNSDAHDAMINNQAVPQLNAQAVTAQSAQLDSISGATFTSQGYLTSLQSAIDRANL